MQSRGSCKTDYVLQDVVEVGFIVCLTYIPICLERSFFSQFVFSDGHVFSKSHHALSRKRFYLWKRTSSQGFGPSPRAKRVDACIEHRIKKQPWRQHALSNTSVIARVGPSWWLEQTEAYRNQNASRMAVDLEQNGSKMEAEGGQNSNIMEADLVAEWKHVKNSQSTCAV